MNDLPAAAAADDTAAAAAGNQGWWENDPNWRAALTSLNRLTVCYLGMCHLALDGALIAPYERVLATLRTRQAEIEEALGRPITLRGVSEDEG